MKKSAFNQELKNLAKSDLVSKRNELSQELFKLRCKKSVSQLETPHRIRAIKRDIARIETQLRAN